MEGVFVMGRFIDITGQRFGRLVVLKRAENFGECTAWLCRCDCGNEKVIRSSSLTNGRTKSCGCFNHEVRVNQKIFLTHGMSHTRQFTIWTDMKNRCYVKTNPDYKNYGGRGITVCDKWHALEGFWEDMKDGYKEDLSLDRINVNGMYCKENCKWSTPTEQSNNRRNNVIMTAFGVTDTLANLCRIFHVNYKTVFARIRYQHLNIEDAITKLSSR